MSHVEEKAPDEVGRCGIKHGFHDGTCIREKGHDGLCRSLAERGTDGRLTYSEWVSRDGKFYSHAGYRESPLGKMCEGPHGYEQLIKPRDGYNDDALRPF